MAAIIPESVTFGKSIQLLKCQPISEPSPNLIPVFLPTHASWLNQIEIYFSIVQRKALTPMDLPDKTAVGDRILNFQERYDQIAKPFRWNFTRDDLQKRLQALAS